MYQWAFILNVPNWTHSEWMKKDEYCQYMHWERSEKWKIIIIIYEIEQILCDKVSQILRSLGRHILHKIVHFSFVLNSAWHQSASHFKLTQFILIGIVLNSFDHHFEYRSAFETWPSKSKCLLCTFFSLFIYCCH